MGTLRSTECRTDAEEAKARRKRRRRVEEKRRRENTSDPVSNVSQRYAAFGKTRHKNTINTINTKTRKHENTKTR
jgi:hypothetical protein